MDNFVLLYKISIIFYKLCVCRVSWQSFFLILITRSYLSVIVALVATKD